MDRGAWWASLWGQKDLDMTERTHTHTHTHTHTLRKSKHSLVVLHLHGGWETGALTLCKDYVSVRWLPGP